MPVITLCSPKGGAGKTTIADRIGRDRKRASLRGAAAAEAAWWLVEHPEFMLALRITRINGDWDAYWKALAATKPRCRQRQQPAKITTPNLLIASPWIAPLASPNLDRRAIAA